MGHGHGNFLFLMAGVKCLLWFTMTNPASAQSKLLCKLQILKLAGTSVHRPLANGIFYTFFHVFILRVEHGTEAIILVILAEWLLCSHGLTSWKSNRNSMQKGHDGLKETGTSASVDNIGLCT